MGRGGDEGEQLRLRLPAEARRSRLRRAARFRAHACGQDERLLLPGLQPTPVLPQQAQDHRGAFEAQVPRHDGSPRDRDIALLGEPWRPQRRRSFEDPDRGHPASLDLLCRGRRRSRQLRPLAAMALAGRDAAGRSEERHLDHGADLAAPESALCEGGRAVSGRHRQSPLALQEPERPSPGGDSRRNSTATSSRR